MKAISIRHIWLTGLVLLLFSCKSWQVESVEPARYRMDTLPSDSAMTEMIAPFKARLDSQMNEVLAELPHDLKKDKPNGNLGFWMADACRAVAAEKTGKKADVAVINQGGIRRPYLKAGVVRVGDIYELMPFDNQLVVMTMNGSLLREVLTIAADRGGDVVSGCTVRPGSHGFEIRIDGVPLEEERLYTVASNDYMYNGGDGYGIMKEADSVKYLGLVRDALILTMRQNRVPFPSAEERRIYLD